jgi:hypothetical protein
MRRTAVSWIATSTNLFFPQQIPQLLTLMIRQIIDADAESGNNTWLVMSSTAIIYYDRDVIQW